MPLVEKLAEIFSLDYLEDKSWDMLDAVRLGDFFENRGIPPYTFPAAIALIAVILLFLFFPNILSSPSSKAFCGDGKCSLKETPFSCPADCGSAKEVKVFISPQAASDQYAVTLYDEYGNPIGRDYLRPGEIGEFGNVIATYVVADVSDSAGGSWESGRIDMTAVLPIANTTALPLRLNDTPRNATPPLRPPPVAAPPISGPGALVITFPDDFDGGVASYALFSAAEVCLEGYLVEGPTAEDAYLEYMFDILDSLNETGVPPAGLNTSCAEINGDGFITIEDLMCLTGIADETFSNTDECLDCPHWQPEEVCREGMDNDCDGQTDKDTYNEVTGEFYNLTGSLVDICSCNELTPCRTLWSITGIPNMTEERFVKRCASINGQDYEWRGWSDWNCTSGRNGWTLVCEGKRFRCTHKRGIWFWNGTGNGTYTLAETISLIAELVNEAKSSPSASDNITLTLGDYITAQDVLDQVSNVTSLEFICTGGCPGVDVSHSSITAEDDVSSTFTATCTRRGAPVHYECEITIGPRLLTPINFIEGVTLNQLIEQSIIGASPLSVAVILLAGTDINSSDILTSLPDVASLDFACEGSCVGLSVTNSRITALQEVPVVFSSVCEEPGAGGYACELTVGTLYMG